MLFSTVISRTFSFVTILRLAGLMTCIVSVSSSGGARAGEAQPPIGEGSFKIVSPEWLSEHTDDAGLRILDVRADVHDYLASHVPYADHLADATMRAPKCGVPVQYLDLEQMAELFRRAGISNNHWVVLYSDGEGVLGATMVAYCLHRVGHKKTMVLDGGYRAYAANHKTSQTYPGYPRGELSPSLDRAVFATLNDVRAAMNDPAVVLIDARPAEAYAGEIATWMRNGHIPGAVNIDWHHLMREDNIHQFKPVEEMAKVIEQAGVRKEDKIIIYCGTSREATLLYLVMGHILGFPGVRLYEGSWTEYCAHDDLPVAKGNTPGGGSRQGAVEK